MNCKISAALLLLQSVASHKSPLVLLTTLPLLFIRLMEWNVSVILLIFFHLPKCGRDVQLSCKTIDKGALYAIVRQCCVSVGVVQIKTGKLCQPSHSGSLL